MTDIIYEIIKTEQFIKKFNSLDNSIKLELEKELEQLKINPYSGKPLGYKFFREKKVRCFRIYYIIYDNYLLVFVLAISDKKDQQKVINTIRNLIPYYKEYIKKLKNG